jgi:predicted dehydrogenase
MAQAKGGGFGKLLEVKAGFLHGSDLDPNKPINWKRRAATCGELGVLGDLGLHATHIPLRLGWKPQSVYARLSKVYARRPDGKGGFADCDTWDNATLATWFESQGEPIPMTLEMKRIAPGEANTWYLEVLGTGGGARYSTKEPKTLWTFSAQEGAWSRRDLGFHGPFPTVTGGIFETGFPDALLQMTAAFALERAGLLGDRFGCATPQEALLSHRLFAAALASQRSNDVFPVGGSGKSAPPRT